jgi:hypothetical protein
MTTVKNMLSDLRSWGVGEKYIGKRKVDIKPVWETCKAIKDVYKEHLSWDEVGAEINLFLSKPSINIDRIRSSVKRHAELRPDDIGKK